MRIQVIIKEKYKHLYAWLADMAENDDRSMSAVVVKLLNKVYEEEKDKKNKK